MSVETKTVSSATTPPLHSPAAAIQAALATLREMLSTADLNKVIDLPGDDREAEQDRGDRARSDRSTSHFGMPTARPSLPNRCAQQITDLTKSGLVSVRSQAIRAYCKVLQSKSLNYIYRPRLVASLAPWSGEILRVVAIVAKF